MSDRKYRQHGYQDEDRDRPRQQGPPGPRAPRGDMIGPRRLQMPARVTVARCANCGTLLPKGFDPNGRCANCGFELHSCKQCLHFDTSALRECTQPIPTRIAAKDARNECTFYQIRMSSERQTSSAGDGSHSATTARPDDPRQAFENLFKKK